MVCPHNNHKNSFVPPPSFSDMVPFYKQALGFTMELKTQSNFKTTGLLQPWQTLCKIFSKCLTTHVTGWDQPPLQIMQMLYCFVNNIHLDYTELLWEGLYYLLHHLTSSIPYPRFIKIIVSHYMTIFPEISRRVRDMYHNLQDDDIMKNIFNSGRHKNKVGMQIPAWMITDEMKHTEHYRMYAEVFGIYVPLTQSQPTKSTQGTYRTISTPRSPNPDKEAAESSAPRRSTVIHLRIPERRSTRLTPPAPVPTEARENVALVDEHLASEKIEKMVYGQENIVDDSSIPRNDEPNIPGTRIEPRSDKESPKVEIDKEKEVKISKEKEERGNIQAQIKTRIDNAIANVIPSQVDASVRSYMSGYILYVHSAQSQTSSVPEQQYQLTSVVRPRDQDDPYDDAHPKGENSAKRQKTSEYEAYVSGESSSGQVFQEEQAPSTSGNQEQDDDFNFWTDSYASDDDEIPTKQVSQDIKEEVSLTIDKDKLRKMADEMLRQRCTSGDEHQYHIDQMKNFLKSDIVWESRKEILVTPHP
ncbi:hypothetical protein Tco_0639575 [Tanacetum coccineum]